MLIIIAVSNWIKIYKNIVFNFLFLVKDLESFLGKLEDLKVNGGLQSVRAKCSLTDVNLSQFDNCFRKSMYLSS